MKKFEVGKKYTHGWISNSEHFTTLEVVKRTEQTITITAMARINDKVVKAACPYDADAQSSYQTWYTAVQEPTA